MYLEFDENFPEHPKSVRLCTTLQHQVAWAYMAKLWCWARKYQKDGDLTDYEPGEIEFAVGWSLADGKFYAAAVRAGFIDEETDAAGIVVSRRLHNWMKRSGGAIKRMEDEATRKRTFRLHQQKKCDAASCQHCATSAEAAAYEAGQGEADFRAAVAESEMSAGRPPDGADQDKSSQSKSKQDQIPLPPQGDLGQTRPKSEDRANEKLTGTSLKKIFSEVRHRVLGGLPWQSIPEQGGKAADMADAIEQAGARADVEPTIRLLLRNAEANRYRDSDRLLKSPALAFGFWCSEWTALREQLHDKAPRAAAASAFVPRPFPSAAKAGA